MKTNTYTHTDYYAASFQRIADFQHLEKEPKSIIFKVYCAGVAIECMLRAFITKNNVEFDSKHDLDKLLIDSGVLSLIETQEEKEELIVAIKKAKNLWNNNLRYFSDKRLKRLIGHELAQTKYKDVTKYFNDKCQALFDAAYLITETGKTKWT